MYAKDIRPSAKHDERNADARRAQVSKILKTKFNVF